MKRIVGLLCILWVVQAFALPLSEQGQAQARLFNDFLQAVYAQRAGDPARFALLQRVLAQAPQSAYIKQQLVAEALAVDNPKLAEPYVDFIEQAQDDPEAWAVYAAYQLRRDRVEQALEAYEKALALDPEDERILYQYISLLALTHPQKAAQALSQLAQSHPSAGAEIYTQMGQMFFYHQQFSQALEAFDKAVSLDEQDPQPRLGRAQVYEKTQQYFLMLHELEMLEQMGFVTAKTLEQMGSVFIWVKDWPKAQHYFQQAKTLDNSSLLANYFLALMAEQAGAYEQAISYLKDSADYTQSAAKQIQVSYYQRKLNQLSASLATLRQVYKQFPDSDDGAFLYAVALYENGAYKKSARVLAPLVEKLPEQPDFRLQYAFALEGQQKYAAMEEQLRTLLEQDPRNAPALNLWAYSLAVRGERLEEAAEYIARALAINPEDASFLDTQAWVFYKQGRYAQAADIISAIDASVQAANPEIAYHASYIYGALQDTDKAHQSFMLGCGQENPKTCLKAFRRVR